MKNILIVILSSMFAVGLYAQNNQTAGMDSFAYAVKGTPVIGGKSPKLWAQTEKININKFLAGVKKGATGTVSALWDEKYLYLLYEVKDKVLSSKAGNPWEKDSVEVFLDENNLKPASYDESDDFQIRVDIDNQITGSDWLLNRKNINDYKSAVRRKGNGYSIELFIPWAVITPKSNDVIGFDAQINDNRGKGTRESIAKWMDMSDNTWSSLENIGSLVLLNHAPPKGVLNVSFEMGKIAFLKKFLMETSASGLQNITDRSDFTADFSLVTPEKTYTKVDLKSLAAPVLPDAPSGVVNVNTVIQDRKAVVTGYLKSQERNAQHSTNGYFFKKAMISLTYEGAGWKYGKIDLRPFESYPYSTRLPKNFDATKKYPLLIFLHGSGERGEYDDMYAAKESVNLGPTDLLDQFIIIIPRCPIETSWQPGPLMKTLEKIKKEHPNIDTKRMILSGFSMGGFGTWRTIIENPSVFAAAVCISGGGEPEKVAAIKDMPIWVFHGANDDVVSPKQDQDMVDALKKIKSKNLEFTVYPGMGHPIATTVFSDPSIFEWMLKQKR